jgi:hypothetical protein
MFGIQTSQTRLTLWHSVTLDNRENFCVRDKYSDAAPPVAEAQDASKRLYGMPGGVRSSDGVYVAMWEPDILR